MPRRNANYTLRTFGICPQLCCTLYKERNLSKKNLENRIKTAFSRFFMVRRRRLKLVLLFLSKIKIHDKGLYYTLSHTIILVSDYNVHKLS